VISDGLNAKAIMDENHLAPYLDELTKLLAEANVPMSQDIVVVTSGRVRARYKIGGLLFEKTDPNSFRGILHINGERPGTMHHSYSVYITIAKGAAWAEKKDDIYAFIFSQKGVMAGLGLQGSKIIRINP
jgi:ethanolamine ammonia-lyase large subunit